MQYKSVDLCIVDGVMLEHGYSMLVQIANELGRKGFHIHHMDYYNELSYIGRLYYTDTPTSPTIKDDWDETPWSIGKLEAMAFLAAEHAETITGAKIVNGKVVFNYGTDED